MPKLPGVLKNLVSGKGKSGSKGRKNKDTATGGADGDVGGVSMSELQRMHSSGAESAVPMLQSLNLQDLQANSGIVGGQYGSPNESEPFLSVSRNSGVQSARPPVRPPRHRSGPASGTREQEPVHNPEQCVARNLSEGDTPSFQRCDYGSRTRSNQNEGAAIGQKEDTGSSQQASITSDYETMTPNSSFVASEQDSPLQSVRHVNPGPASLLVPAENVVLDQDESLDSVGSSHSGFHTPYPTVIERTQRPADSSAGHASSLAPQRQPRLAGCQSAPILSRPSSQPSPSPRPAPRAGPHTAPVVVNPAVADTNQSRSSRGPPRVSEVHGPPRRPFDPVVPEEVDCELFPESALSTPIGALRKSRKWLCLMLNIEQVPLEGVDLPRDYTGLAEMLGFEAIEIQNFWDRNPCDTLFMEWCRCHDSTLLEPILRTLVDCLEKLGRRDVLEDCRGRILEDVSDYIAEQQLLRRYTVDRLEKFDCYINIAEQDILTIGREILDTLEGVYKLRLCLTLRDVTLGGCPYEKMAEMLETRCNSKCLIVLTKSYGDSDECQFLTQFAVALDPGSRRNKLIPLLVDEDVSIPRVLRVLAMLNFYRDRRLGFLWPRLKHAITQ